MELKLTRDKVSQAMMEECLQTEASFLPHSARPKHPKPLGHRQCAMATRSSHHSPCPLVLRVTHQNPPTSVHPGPTLDFPSLPNDSNHPGRLRQETQFLSLAFFHGKNCLRGRGLQDSPPSQQQVAQGVGSTGSITYTFRVRGRSRRSA